MNQLAIGPVEFGNFFNTYYKPLCLFANSYLDDLQAAEDIVEESFIKLWECRQEIRHQAAVYSWLCTTVKNKSLNALRAKKNRSERQETWNAASSIDPADHLERMLKAELVCELHQLIHSLPTQCSKVFVKLYIEDLSMNEASIELGLSVNTIKSHKARGLALLRHKLHPLMMAFLLA
jgi:RNA polymerase sigma-70 factor (family 1)